MAKDQVNIIDLQTLAGSDSCFHNVLAGETTTVWTLQSAINNTCASATMHLGCTEKDFRGKYQVFTLPIVE